MRKKYSLSRYRVFEPTNQGPSIRASKKVKKMADDDNANELAFIQTFDVDRLPLGDIAMRFNATATADGKGPSEGALYIVSRASAVELARACCGKPATRLWAKPKPARP